MIDTRDLHEFQLFFDEHLFNEIDELENFNPKNFRLEYKTRIKKTLMYEDDFVSKLSYKESKKFYYNMIKFNHYSNFQIKCTLAAIYRINQKLLTNYKFINILVQN